MAQQSVAVAFLTSSLPLTLGLGLEAFLTSSLPLTLGLGLDPESIQIHNGLLCYAGNFPSYEMGHAQVIDILNVTFSLPK